MIRPLQDCVVLRKKRAKDVTTGGIVLPESSRNTAVAEVVAVGPGLQLDSGEFMVMGVEVGDAVIVPSGVVEIQVGEESLFVARISAILGVL